MTRAAFVAAAVIFFALALSNDVYQATSPPWLSWHVLLRKIYSVGAFSLVGWLFAASFPGRNASAPRAGVAIGLYSALIEIAQALHGSREGLAFNAIDVACGVAGGVVGSMLTRMPLPSRTTQPGPSSPLQRG